MSDLHLPRKFRNKQEQKKWSDDIIASWERLKEDPTRMTYIRGLFVGNYMKFGLFTLTQDTKGELGLEEFSETSEQFVFAHRSKALLERICSFLNSKNLKCAVVDIPILKEGHYGLCGGSATLYDIFPKEKGDTFWDSVAFAKRLLDRHNSRG